MIACSAAPADRNDAVNVVDLADVAMATGDFTPAVDGGGRKLTVGAKSAVAIDHTGDATHVAFVDATRLLYVTTCTLQGLTQGGTVDFPSHSICKIPQPS